MKTALTWALGARNLEIVKISTPIRKYVPSFIAPQAQLEESANDRGSRRCSLVEILRGIHRSFWGLAFRVFANGILDLAVQKTIMAELEIRSILSG